MGEGGDPEAEDEKEVVAGPVTTATEPAMEPSGQEGLEPEPVAAKSNGTSDATGNSTSAANGASQPSEQPATAAQPQDSSNGSLTFSNAKARRCCQPPSPQPGPAQPCLKLSQSGRKPCPTVQLLCYLLGDLYD